MNKIKTQFKKSFKWNTFGSIFYESTKVLNQIFLIRAMSPNNYGLMAATFSFIYFIMYLSEFGATQALPAFLNIFIQNQQNFKKYFLRSYFIPQIIIYSLAAIIASFFYNNSFLQTQSTILSFIIPISILFEGIRSLQRRFLHNVFATKKTVLVETILMTIFLIAIWLPHIITKQEISLNDLFSIFLITSITGVIFFTILMFNYYKEIPNESSSTPHKIISRIIKTRLLSYFTHISKNFFSGNFLTPFFAANFGLPEAGIFNIANHIAESVKAITKSIIIFTGGGVFAKLKLKSIKLKKLAFKLISTSLNNIIYPVLIFILINSKFIFNLNNNSITGSATSMTLLFFVITGIELFFMAYEQFYTVEEKVEKLFLFKIIEILLFYSVITSKMLSNPILILIGLLIIKIISYTILALNAYSQWKLKPVFTVKLNIIIITILVSLIFKIFI